MLTTHDHGLRPSAAIETSHIVRRGGPPLLQAAAAGVPRLLLRLPSSCLLPNPTRHEPYMLFILRHVLEDPVTLGGWMEAEIRNFFAQRARGAPNLFGMQQRAQQVRHGRAGAEDGYFTLS